MACNAWNHPSNCNCGWGGVFYGSGYKDGDGDSWHWQRSDSYTVPNASCPRCTARVFFYRSPYGGSVYFDELGPPWPKHLCMDVAVPATPHAPRGEWPAAVAGSKHSKPGPHPRFKPLICEGVRRHDRSDQVVVLKVHAGAGGPKRLYAVFDRTLLDHRTPFLVRSLPGGDFEISTLNTFERVPSEVRFTAYASVDRLPQPYRDRIQGLASGHDLPAGATTPSAAPPAAPAISSAIPIGAGPDPGKRPRPEPTPAHVAHSVPKGSVRPLIKLPVLPPKPVAAQRPVQPANQKAPSKASDGLRRGRNGRNKGSDQSQAPSAGPVTKKVDKRTPTTGGSAAEQPLTNMQLAFQRLAASDPAVQEALVSGLRSKPKQG